MTLFRVIWSVGDSYKKIDYTDGVDTLDGGAIRYTTLDGERRLLKCDYGVQETENVPADAQPDTAAEVNVGP